MLANWPGTQRISAFSFSFLAIVAITGCGGLRSSSGTKTLESLSVTPATASIAVGVTQQFQATGTYSDGSSANLTSSVAWSSTTGSVASVNASGLATAAATGATSVIASLSGVSGSSQLSVTAAPLTSIAVTPATASIAVGATQQFTATGTYSDGSTANLTSSVSWSSSDASIASIASSGLATGTAAGSTTITAALGGVSGSASLAVTTTVAAGVNVLTYHMDIERSGLNPNEAYLSPSTVTPKTFGKLFSYLVDGYLYAQPLLVSNLTVGGEIRNVIYVATENDSVYAFDADNYNNGNPLWQTSLLQANETPIEDGPIQPVQGTTSTPVIDAVSGVIYVVSTQVNTTTGASTFRLNGLNLLTGAQMPGSPITIQAQVPGTNSDNIDGIVYLTTSCVQRAALLLSNGTIYIGFGGCHSGWLLAYNEQSLAQTGVFNASPNLNGEGQYASAGGVWMGGGGPAQDSNGYIYITTGNGPWDGQTAWGDSIIKFSNDGKLTMVDYFTPDDYHYMNCHDADLASGGLLLIPGSSQALAGGKTGVLYLVNQSNLGQESQGDTGAAQVVPGLLTNLGFDPYSSSCTDTQGTWTTNINSYESFSTATYFNGWIYLGITPTSSSIPVGVVQLTYDGTMALEYDSTPPLELGSNGATPFVSANGNANGVLWLLDHGYPIQNQDPSNQAPTSAVLRAYDPTNLGNGELYDSTMNANDAPGYGIKFTVPIAANGKVYIGTAHDLDTVANPQGELDVYGLTQQQ
jgi:hypothetical protein